MTRRDMVALEGKIEKVADAVLKVEAWNDREHERLDNRMDKVAADFTKTLKDHMTEEADERKAFTASVNGFSEKVGRLSGQVDILKVIGMGIFASLVGLVVTVAVK